jgi:hypothetical protein
MMGMRILLAFIIGFLSFFYLTELFVRFGQKYRFLQKLSFRYSFIGFVVIVAGFILGVTANSDATKVLSGMFMMGSGLGMMMHHLLSRSFVFFEGWEHKIVKDHQNVFERLLEIFPGALTWIALTSPIWLSFTLPFAVAGIILLADAYWLISGIRVGLFILLGYRKMEEVKKVDWLKRLDSDFPDEYQKYYHLIALPCYNESMEVVGPSIDAVVNSKYPKDKIYLGLGREAWAKPELIQETLDYVKKNQGKIAGILPIIHELQEGEHKGPATNRNNIIRTALKEFEKRGIDPQNVLVTTLDADFVIHPQFLAGALHKYLSTPANVRDKRSFTGAFLYYNNYWQAPTPMRLIAAGTQFWQLAEMYGSDKYMNFSSLSINMQSLLDIGLWMPNKVNDDSGFYWKAYYHFKGDYKVLPHFLPIYGDTVLDTNFVKTIQNQYLQLKRWAYGVEHVPFVFKQYFINKDLDFWDKTDKLIFVMWGYLKWGVLALFVSFAGLLIPIVNPNYTESVVYYRLPQISSWILTIAFFAQFSSIYVHEKTAPPRPANWSLIRRIWTYFQWLLVPLIIVTIATLPAIHAQTQLMFGRYMQFRVTNKARVKS